MNDEPYRGEAAYLLEGDDQGYTGPPPHGQDLSHISVPLVIEQQPPDTKAVHSGHSAEPIRVDTEKPPRQTIVVDCETNGLDYSQHVPVEVAWWNLDTGQRGSFVPRHDVHTVLFTASIDALRINRYIDRLATAEQDGEGLQALALAEMLRGNTLAGSNIRFDAHMLTKIMPETWHYRLLELGAYGAGVLRLPPEDGVPGLFDLCAMLGVEQEGDVHTAEAGVTATGECLTALRAHAAEHRYCDVPQRAMLGSDPAIVGETSGPIVVADPAHEPPGFDWTQSLRPWNRKD